MPNKNQNESLRPLKTKRENTPLKQMKTAREKILTNPALARILNPLFLNIFGVMNQSVKKKGTTQTTLMTTVGLKRIKLEIISNTK